MLLLRDRVRPFGRGDRSGAGDQRRSGPGVMHHRARAALAGYDEQRAVPTRERLVLVRSALERLAAAVRAGDPAEVQLSWRIRPRSTRTARAASAPFVSSFAVRGRWRVAILSQQRLAGVPTRQSIWATSTERRRWSSMQRHHRERTFPHGSYSAATSTTPAASPASTCWRPRPGSRPPASLEGLGFHQVDHQAHHPGDGPRESSHAPGDLPARRSSQPASERADHQEEQERARSHHVRPSSPPVIPIAPPR